MNFEETSEIKGTWYTRDTKDCDKVSLMDLNEVNSFINLTAMGKSLRTAISDHVTSERSSIAQSIAHEFVGTLNKINSFLMLLKDFQQFAYVLILIRLPLHI